MPEQRHYHLWWHHRIEDNGGPTHFDIDSHAKGGEQGKPNHHHSGKQTVCHFLKLIHVDKVLACVFAKNTSVVSVPCLWR